MPDPVTHPATPRVPVRDPGGLTRPVVRTDDTAVPPWAHTQPAPEARRPEAQHRLAAVLREHPGTLVLTGAGMSTDSGIPDYRGRDGTRRVMPMQHADFCASTENRRTYWARSFVGWGRFSQAAPNDGHRAVADLQRAGVLGPVVTQNVDGLHQAAGSPDVTELHGTLAEVVCLTCEDRTARTELQRRMAEANSEFDRVLRGGGADGSQVRPDGDVVLPDALVAGFRLPHCLVCGTDTLKPDVVFFGGSVPRERVDHVFALVDAAPALLVLGSSLAVMSGLRFVRHAARRGVPVMAVTRGPTRGDGYMTLRVDNGLAPTLRTVLDLVGRAA